MDRILVKLPSRGRRETLVNVVHKLSALCVRPELVHIAITIDADDMACPPPLLRSRLHGVRAAVSITAGPRTTKVGAFNRDMPPPDTWDILVAASDDHWPQVHGWDEVLRRDMATHWPDGDGCLWYSDGRQSRVCTLSIMHRTYYLRRGHVYDPRFLSYYCDDVYTEEATRDGRMVKLPTVLFRNEHPCHAGAMPDDALYRHNRQHKAADRAMYLALKAQGFPHP